MMALYNNRLLSIKILTYGACACTLIAGILHLTIVPQAIKLGSTNGAIFFLVAGIAQLFWIIPILKRWGKVWYGIGVGGTAILFVIWIIAIMPDNPITEIPVPVEALGITVAVFEIAFIVLCSLIITRDRRTKEGHKKQV